MYLSTAVSRSKMEQEHNNMAGCQLFPGYEFRSSEVSNAPRTTYSEQEFAASLSLCITILAVCNIHALPQETLS